MKRRVFPFLLAVLVSGTLLPRSASAAVISLESAIEGSALGGEVIDLTVSFALNGSAENLVGVELYVGFTGLTPGSYALGGIFDHIPRDIPGGPPGDLGASNGLCSDLATGCSEPMDLPLSLHYYLSRVFIFAPSVATGPGTLFTLQFTAPTATNWTLNLFGEPQVALQSDPLGTCDPVNLDCVEFPPIPFAIVAGTPVVPGTARLDVSVNVIPPASTAVPEPATLLLMGSGLAAIAVRKRAVRRRQS